MSSFLKTILLATDGSADAAVAGTVAADLAARTGAPLHVVHAWQVVLPSAEYVAMVNDDMVHLAEEAAQGTLQTAVDRLAAEGATVAGAHLRNGYPPDEIVSLARELGAGLLAIGSRGLGRVQRLVMGSVSEGVVHHAPCPVLVLRGGEAAWPPARIVVGEDGSAAAERAGLLAAQLGRLYGARMVLARAYPDLPLPLFQRPIQATGLRDDAMQRAEEALHEQAVRLEALLGSRPETVDTVDDPAALLLATAEGGPQPALLAAGSRGLSTLQRLRLGSVSTKVLRAAHGPVLVYPHEPGGRGPTPARP